MDTPRKFALIPLTVKPDIYLDDDAAVIAIAKRNGFYEQAMNCPSDIPPHLGKIARLPLENRHGVACVLYFSQFTRACDNGWVFAGWSVDGPGLPARQEALKARAEFMSNIILNSAAPTN